MRKAAPKTKQGEAFKKLARELGCDESEANFEKALAKIGRAPPQPKTAKKKRKPLKIAL